MNKKILVTGSKGFIGHHLVKELLNNSFDVIGIDIKDGIDTTKWECLSDFKNIGTIVHLAAKSFVPDSYKDPRDFYFTNITSTLNLLELARINHAKFIYISSYVYGHPEYLPIDEKHPVRAFNPYSSTKIIGERLCQSYHEDFGIPVIIFRPFNIYGPGQADHFLIPLIIKQFKQRNISINDLRPKRDYIYIDDVINAFIKAIEWNEQGSFVFNLGTSRSYSVKEILDYLYDITSEDFEIKDLKKIRKNEVLDTVADISLITDKLNWQPHVELKRGLTLILKETL
jgi:nucleoside-diphosphate-sugar epimerase